MRASIRWQADYIIEVKLNVFVDRQTLSCPRDVVPRGLTRTSYIQVQYGTMQQTVSHPDVLFTTDFLPRPSFPARHDTNGVVSEPDDSIIRSSCQWSTDPATTDAKQPRDSCLVPKNAMKSNALRRAQHRVHEACE